jgi:serine/threonine protein kinase
MKSLKKEILIEHNQIENELIEKEILQKLKYPFLCELIFCFQNIDHIYFIMPFLSGGELFQHFKKFQNFDEEKVRFYGAQIALALDFLHKNDIIYRDLKPENILMDENGYLKLINFGMATKLKKINKSLSGTPEYIAPEIIKGEGIYKSSDWWSFGILLYEMLCGLPPFYDENMEKMYEMIKNESITFPNKYNLSDDAKDIIKKLLNKNPNERLGNKNEIDEIKTHPFFSTIDFELIENKKIPAPFIPNINDNKDVKYFEEEYINEDIENKFIPENKMDLINNNQDKFKDFDD